MRCLGLLLVALTSSSALAVPTLSTHQGRMFDALGAPLDGDHDLDLSLHDAATNGTALWAETQLDVAFDDGYFVVDLGAVNALEPDAFDGSVLWFELSVDGSTPLPRLPLHSVPYAFNAASAETATTATTADSALSVEWANVSGAPSATLSDLGCSAGDAAVWDGAAWGCDDMRPINAAEITEGVLDIAQIPVGGSNAHVAAGDHDHAYGQITGMVPLSALPVGNTSSEIAAGSHTHTISEIGGGSVPTSALDVGDQPGTVAAGDHSHALSDLSGDLEIPIVSSPPSPASGVGKLYAMTYDNEGGADANNVLLIHSDSVDGATGFIDSSPAANPLSVSGNVSHAGDVQKFGATALDFRSGGYLAAPDSPNWDFPGDFTVDFWVYLESRPYAFILVHRNYGNWNGSWHAYTDSVGAGTMIFSCRFAGGADGFGLSSDTPVPLNTWTHVAAVRSGPVATLYLDGVQVAQDTDAAGNCGGDPAQLRVGDLQNYSGDAFDGLLDEVRISKGVARWTGPFTPPTRAYDAGGSGVGVYFIDDAGNERQLQFTD